MGVGDGAALHELHEAVGEELRVNAEAAAVRELAEHRVGHEADARLDRGAVLDQGGHVTADRAVHVRQRPARVDGEGPMRLHGRGDAAAVDDAVTVRARHVLVHLGDDGVRHLARGNGGINTHAHGAEPVGVRRGHLDDRHVEREHLAAEERRDFRQEARDVVGAPGGDGLAHVGAGKQRRAVERAGRLLGRQLEGPLRLDGVHLHARELWAGAASEGLNERQRSHHGAVHEDALGRTYEGHCLGGGHVRQLLLRDGGEAPDSRGEQSGTCGRH
mmetsp:Transcript_11743/g.40107  ORF Transcript_11743/g.40107 Transcript_11743/m.40107 type:complete len:274 (-) Transcript_11743:39-860(-)